MACLQPCCVHDCNSIIACAKAMHDVQLEPLGSFKGLFFAQQIAEKEAKTLLKSMGI